MNFYKRHIGDYIKDAGHLTLLEHGVYSRLMDVYYSREAGIPDDKAARLIGARSKDELAAMRAVLEEFFEDVDGIWMHSRCEREIEAATAVGDKNRENGKKGGRPRKTDKPEKPSGLIVGSENGTQNNLSQTPDSRHQTPDLKTYTNPDGGGSQVVHVHGSEAATVITAVQVAMVMRECGVDAQAANPVVIAIAGQAVSLDTVRAACMESVQAKPGERVSAQYVAKKIEGWASKARSLEMRGAQVPSRAGSGNGAGRSAAAASIGLGGRSEPYTIDQ